VKGFTLVELVVVILLVGIMAVAVVPRFVGRTGFDARGFSDEATAMLRYGQKLAVAQHTSVFVRVTGSTLDLCYDSGCTQRVLSPADRTNSFTKTAASGVTVVSSTGVFSFDALGRPNPDAEVSLQVMASGEPTRTITVERETGYVHL
jgi:MSHA pilin protein MshC